MTLKPALPRLAAAAALIYLALAFSYELAWMARLDAALAAWFYHVNHPGVLVATWLSHSGNFVASLALAALFGLILRRQGRIAWPGLPLFVALAWGTNTALKALSYRPRPSYDPLVATLGSSFPSGHAMGAWALGWVLAWLLARQWPAWRGLWYLLALLWVLAGGLARLVLGVHHFSDIMAGYAAATVLAALFVHFASSRPSA
ncbi:phosphatase PAP2 family protein [Chitiniphilus purpureus]|uniref:Phosphatase PAP2 family protein n=1 Tax=Chitiniphilus purpureus TaxID=2981137 RepID=A0ABY6DMP4_9NEIS|nr:phosphatase PAP2 family protein [Chitiniphilus sp. CD1]UXY15645.1 phosphatase PAP2 family protein [Chitiniphilus sp. CD1]